MDDEKQVWEQQEGESNRWFQRFCAFRLLGPGRSLLECFNQEKVVKSREKSLQAAGSWRKAAEQWNWRSRADAWDKYVTTQAETKWLAKVMSGTESIARISDMARGDLGEMMDIESMSFDINLQKAQETGKTNLIKKVKQISKMTQGKNGDDTETHIQDIELYSALDALVHVAKYHNLFSQKEQVSPDDTEHDILSQIVWARLLKSISRKSFLDVAFDIDDRKHTEYLFFGGRGSTKSSFVSLVTIYLLVNNPGIHALAVRQVGNTLRDSVYSQLRWAIDTLGLSDKFKCTTSPLGIEYLPTKQQIYFRGADDPLKIKSIKPPFGYIGILVFEELDQFHGPEQVRSIEQSAIRGGDEAWIFKSFNPPRTSQNWANKYAQIPKPSQYQHKSDYTTVPPEWLGRTFLEEAEFLQTINPGAYAHEYLGEVNGAGGMVFENVIIRKITDEEIFGKEDGRGHKIGGFDRIGQGMDFGWYPDPLAWGKSHFDANRRKLYIFDEYKANKKANREVYNDLVKLKGYLPDQLIIADSASPKDIADFREYGASVRGAEKGPESVTYSYKWLQGLTEIVIDPERAPEHAQEFLNCEYEMDKDGNYISAYPDYNNHFIDEIRYAHNLTWKRRGQ